MLIKKIGEFGLIERFKKNIKTDPSAVVGSGDDCAVLKFNKDKYLLYTTDMIVEGVDFKKDEDPYLIGRKAVAVSISDIAACAGVPKYCVISAGFKKNTKVSFTDRLMKGITDIAKEFRINIVGGDLSSSSATILDVSMLGIVEKNNLLLRSGAKEKDIIFVTGPLGGSIKGKHLRFKPRIDEARFLAKNFKINSMIDISDGLIADLFQILAPSKKGAVIYEDLIPISKDAKNLDDALYSGEDFELLFTSPPDSANKIISSKNNSKERFSFIPIGQISHSREGMSLIDKKSRLVKLQKKGFRHF